ncbi:hypothetical protein V5D56_00050 (plasmid) [Cellulosimicrobium sp. PMB13]|uniref:hypothetical protein n=1 Tax=Cellulosimicrobium sp. PMB13 TaxID=3120158 RepID=UPI003F4CAB27
METQTDALTLAPIGIAPPPMLAPLHPEPRGRVPLVRPAWKFLTAAHKSTSALLQSLLIVRQANKETAGKTHGRYSNEEIDLLRAAIVFTSSGLDACLQRLVRDALPALVRRDGTPAQRAYTLYLKQELAAENIAEPFRDAVLAPDPTQALLAGYVSMRTKASYQGSKELQKRVRDALGVPRAAVPDQDLAALDPFFIARNAIVHGMDYETPRKRTHRARADTIAQCDLVFDVAGRLIIETAKVLRNK